MLIQKNIILLSIFLIVVASCTHPAWEEHYQGYEAQVDTELWETLQSEPRYSGFVELMENYGLDSVIRSGLSLTLFVPDNEALSSLADTSRIMKSILEHHISKTVFLTRNVNEVRKLETLGKKFPLVSETAEGYTYDLVPIVYSSPLHLNGVFYELEEVAYPRPNLYEFTELYSEVIQDYIDLSDSAYLDKSLSKPIGFNDEGNTVYDSVFTVVNRFERDFFPVSREFRDKTATFVLFTQEQYDLALDVVAETLGPPFMDHTDIPEVWQDEVLLPSVMTGSLFDNMLSYHQFQDTMVSVTGDTVQVDPANINSDSRFLCSNGLTYTYYDFMVPKELYVGEHRIEGESLVDSIGANSFAWKPEVEVWGLSVAPIRTLVEQASEGKIATVNFPLNFSGEWGMRFHFKNVFPMKYRLLWRSTYRPSGKYRITVNGQILEYTDRYGRKLTEFDTWDLNATHRSVIPGERFIPDGLYNSVDYWVESITEFGDVEIEFEYYGSGGAENNGFLLDYVVLIPAEEF